MRLDDLRSVVRAGDGLVGRFPDAVLVVSLGGPVDPAAVDRLLDACAGGSVATRLDELRAAAGAGVPTFAVVVDTGDDLAVFVAGDAQVAITGAGPVLRLSGRDEAGWTSRVSDRFASLSVGVHLGDAGAGVDPRFDLRAGVVPGSGVVLAPPSPPAPPAPPVAPPVAEPEKAVTEAPPPPPPPGPAPVPAAAEARPPAPPTMTQVVEVWGIRCKKGHFNDPEARYCGMCGIHMVQDSAARVKGPRPVLGFMVLDDGTTYKLDADYVIGSDPQDHEAVRDGRARPLVIADGDGVISPVHARIVLRDWTVEVSDCGSVYGTYVWAPGTTAWERLTPEQPVTLVAGSQVMVAQRGFMFQPVNKR